MYLKPQQKHVCKSHFNFEPGSLACHSEHVQIKRVPERVESLKYREKEIWNLVESVMKGSRLITLLGLNGIGKSTVARDAVHFMLERKYFTGGVIFINLKQVQSFRLFINKVKRILLKNLDLSYCNALAKIENPSSEAFTEFLIDMFNGKEVGWRLETMKYTS